MSRVAQHRGGLVPAIPNDARGAAFSHQSTQLGEGVASRADTQTRSAGGETLLEFFQAVMQPPAGGSARRPRAFFGGRMNENRNDRRACLDRGAQCRIVGDSQVLTKPNEGAHPLESGSARPRRATAAAAGFHAADAGAFSYNSPPICADCREMPSPCRNHSQPHPPLPPTVETVIIGAGPVGLFQIFELGLLGIGAHIIDSLAQVGGQCTELYPDKPIYDIPALPICGAQELIDRLLEQAKPFHATFHLGQEVTELEALPDGKFQVATSAGTRLTAGAVVIAAGVGSFQPRRLAVPGRRAVRGQQRPLSRQVRRRLSRPRSLICGGGDSALDWTVALCEKARSLTLVHRRAEFRAAPATVARMRELVAAGKMQYRRGPRRRPAERQSQAHRRAHSEQRWSHPAASRRRTGSGVLRPAPQTGPGRRLGLGTREEGAQGRYGEVPDQCSGDFRHRRHQYLSRQEEVDLERFSRGRTHGVRAFSTTCSRRSASSCSTPPRARSCRSGSVSPLPTRPRHIS